MNKNARLWIDALRSGRFKQGRGHLTMRDQDCCLGVACKVYIEAGNTLRVGTAYSGDITYDDFNITLPPSVQDWLGLRTYLEGDLLADYNDSGKTFDEIADIIEMIPAAFFAEDDEDQYKEGVLPSRHRTQWHKEKP